MSSRDHVRYTEGSRHNEGRGLGRVLERVGDWVRSDGRFLVLERLFYYCLKLTAVIGDDLRWGFYRYASMLKFIVILVDCSRPWVSVDLVGDDREVVLQFGDYASMYHVACSFLGIIFLSF